MRHYIDLSLSLNTTFVLGQVYTLPVHHVAVLRRKLNDFITLFDGHGNSCEAIFETITKTQATVKVCHIFEKSTPLAITIELAQCLPTLEKMDWVIEKFTELGGNELTVLEGQKNIVRLSGERVAKKQVRWKELLIASCMQCERNYLPKLNDFQTTEQFFGISLNSNSNLKKHFKILLAPTANSSLVSKLQEIKSQSLDKSSNQDITITIAVGPESGFSTKEVELASKNGWVIARLGTTILRTETVGLVAITLIQGILGEFI